MKLDQIRAATDKTKFEVQKIKLETKSRDQSDSQVVIVDDIPRVDEE